MGSVVLPLLQQVIIACEIERQLLLLEEPLICRVPRAIRRPVGEAVAALANDDLAATGRLGCGNLDAPWGGESVARSEVPLTRARAVHEHFHIGRVGEFAAERHVIREPLDHHCRLLRGIPIVAVTMARQPDGCLGQEAARAILLDEQLDGEGRCLAGSIVPIFHQAVVVPFPVHIDVADLGFLFEQGGCFMRTRIADGIEREAQQGQAFVA